MDPHEHEDNFEHETFEVRDTSPEAVERVWRTFWLPAIRDPGTGRVDLQRLKAELYDCHHLIMNAPRVYHRVTGGLCGDPCASAEGILALYEKKQAELLEALRREFSPTTTERNDAHHQPRAPRPEPAGTPAGAEEEEARRGPYLAG